MKANSRWPVQGCSATVKQMGVSDGDKVPLLRCIVFRCFVLKHMQVLAPQIPAVSNTKGPLFPVRHIRHAPTHAGTLRCYEFRRDARHAAAGGAYKTPAGGRFYSPAGYVLCPTAIPPAARAKAPGTRASRGPGCARAWRRLWPVLQLVLREARRGRLMGGRGARLGRCREPCRPKSFL